MGPSDSTCASGPEQLPAGATSTPAGINCVLAASGVTGPCSARFAAGTVVRLDVRPDADSSFLGWRGLPGCFDASKVTIFANTNISCQPGLMLRF